MKNGYIALISVLVIGAIATMVTVAVLSLGLASSRTSFVTGQSFQAMALADACIEEALEQIANSVPFTGNGTLSLGQGTCSYTVTNTGGQTRSVVSQGSMATTVRKVSVVVGRIRPSISLSSWQEVP